MALRLQFGAAGHFFQIRCGGGGEQGLEIGDGAAVAGECAADVRIRIGFGLIGVHRGDDAIFDV